MMWIQTLIWLVASTLAGGLLALWMQRDVRRQQQRLRQDWIDSLQRAMGNLDPASRQHAELKSVVDNLRLTQPR